MAQYKVNEDGLSATDLDTGQVVKISDLKNYKVENPTTSISAPVQETKTFGQKILDTGTSVANFVGAKGISDEFGATIARSKAAPENKEFVEFPTTKEVIGSAIQTGANFIPGLGEAGLGAKVALGAATGLAYDVGSKLQENKSIGESLKPGIATYVSAVLPLAGQLFGKLTEKGTQKLAQNLERANLRLTPKDTAFIEKSKPDFIPWLTEHKITGNPQQRFEKVSNLYDEFENKVQSSIKDSSAMIPKSDFVKVVSDIPEQFIDDPDLMSAAQNSVDRLIKTAQEKYPNEIPLDFVNSLKRNYGKRAFNKAGQDVTNETSYQISQNLYDLIKQHVPELEKLNDEYSKVILAKKLMYKALGRSQIGIVGKIASSAVGGSVGTALGGPVGTGIGIIAGERAASNLLGTKTRSITGASLQKLYEKVTSSPKSKNTFNISKKLLLNLLEKARQ